MTECPAQVGDADGTINDVDSVVVRGTNHTADAIAMDGDRQSAIDRIWPMDGEERKQISPGQSVSATRCLG